MTEPGGGSIFQGNVMQDNSNAGKTPQPMMIRSPEGHLFPVQSLRACATRLGQILRHITGEDRKFVSWQALRGWLEIGTTTIADGPLKGWSFYACDNDQTQVSEFLTHIGVPAGSPSRIEHKPTNPQDHKPSNQQTLNTSIPQNINAHSGTTLDSLWNHSETKVTSETKVDSLWNHSETKVTSEPRPSELTSIPSGYSNLKEEARLEFEAIFGTSQGSTSNDL